MSFASLGLLPALLDALSSRSYTEPTPIQSAAIPPVLAGRDVLGSAQTGSGKTLAFALPLLQRLLQSPAPAPRRPRALVLVPTRELAVQVGEEFHSLALRLPEPLKVTVVFGGVSINPQMIGLRRGTDLVVATPGRLLDLVDRNALSLSAVQTLVLDEADRLLDLGFAQELEDIQALLPDRRQNLFFSATFPREVQALAHSLLHEPVHIEVADEAAPVPDILQRVVQVDAARRTQLLRHLIAQEQWSRVLVFVATQHATEVVAEKLRKAGLSAEPFHGDLSQGKRTQVLSDFKASRLSVVVATDVAARGLDITDLPVVVNYDLPRSTADYTHRIGRTGRAGASGVALSFVSAATEAHFRLIEKREGLRVPREQVAGFEPQEVELPAAQGNGGIKGKRPSKKDKLRAAAAAAQRKP